MNEANVIQAAEQQDSAGHSQSAQGYRMGNPAFAFGIGLVMASGVYAAIYAFSSFGATESLVAPLRRYFLGHPVAVAATILFCFALGTLIAKSWAVMVQNNFLNRIADDHLLPSLSDASSPAKQWLAQNDAGHVAKQWQASLSSLSQATRQSQLVRRLDEVLSRQSQRGSSKQLPDDLRELSSRDADAAHDSLGMVRIIVWAIPMLGFLGTVIGITQTLGGLDFTNGSAAVDNLKSGLYVAFDTTAVGLVLSVVAIFIQFPVERAEQQMLDTIDARIGRLVSANLPSDEASDNQTALIADLCRGVQAAVAESLENQAELWKNTIESAQNQWQSVHDHNNDKIVEAFKVSLVPALVQHSEVLSKSQDRFDSLAMIEQSLDKNLQMLARTTAAIEQNQDHRFQLRSETDQSMADAVRTLARAVDVLTRHMAKQEVSTHGTSHSKLNVESVSSTNTNQPSLRRAA
ncbi:MotA/TolQ/ExbB proton channel family protein [Rubripirellula amarantea]|uniref:MotA/TolQ/ExbB proton channel family protein n=1 Tax=Rubripirellula amarantea TaxID=2527999 RepID=A0A5C5WSY6_9BACT|nr:MotA/TolQ/ExbB proton channel family protein [Rubripirellula amarantea]TWT53265.1 MotA/TolQ/ExbB proton channel family protein [Rubripirellula amarantea]